MIKRVGFILLFLSGCTTVPRDQEFRGNQGQSYLIVAADDMSGFGAFRFYFRKVDLKEARFLDDRASVAFPQSGALAGDELEKPGDLPANTRYGGTALSPGDYALVYRIDTYGALASSTMVNCFAQGAPVFRVAEGQINIVGAGSVLRRPTRDPALLQGEVTQVLKGYPGFTAPVTTLTAVGSITFRTGENWAGVQTCTSLPEPFQFRPRATGN